MNDKEKRIKSSLLQTRKIIVNKFHKLRRDRAIIEKHLQERYAPITDSIDKLIKTKENISSKNSRINEPNKLKKENDDLMDFEDSVGGSDYGKEFDPFYEEKKNELPPKSHENIDSANESKIKKEEKALDHRAFKSKDFDISPKEQLKSSKRDCIRSCAFERRKKLRSNFNDTFRSNLKEYYGSFDGDKQRIKDAACAASKTRARVPICNRDIERDRTNYFKNRAAQRLRFYDARRINPKITYNGNNNKIINSIDVASKKRISKAREIDTIRKSERRKLRNDINDGLRTLESNKTQTKRVVISPEDYDADGNFVGLATKRRKVERKKVIPSVIISPEDYDIDGRSTRIATKRRKIEIPIDKLSSLKKQFVAKLQKNAANERRSNRIVKVNRIKSGKCLENKFIPYSENIVYEYYDNVNELCDRLRLLVSSKAAGNSNHDQEINSILQEMRERHIIE